MKLAGLFLLLATSLTVGAVSIACTSGDDGNPKGSSTLSACVPNQTLVCLCGIVEGTQTCTEDKKLTECVCPPSNPFPQPTGTTTSEPPVTNCGNGQVDEGEACDDGNEDNTDGCNKECKPEGTPLTADDCPGQVVHVWKGKPVKLTGTTNELNDNLQTSCVSSSGPDRIYAVTAHIDGNMSLKASWATGFDAVLEVREGTCNVPAAKVFCVDTFNRPQDTVIPVKKDQTYFVIIDGYRAEEKGSFTIDLEIP